MYASEVQFATEKTDHNGIGMCWGRHANEDVLLGHQFGQTIADSMNKHKVFRRCVFVCASLNDRFWKMSLHMSHIETAAPLYASLKLTNRVIQIN